MINVVGITKIRFKVDGCEISLFEAQMDLYDIV